MAFETITNTASIYNNIKPVQKIEGHREDVKGPEAQLTADVSGIETPAPVGVAQMQQENTKKREKQKKEEQKKEEENKAAEINKKRLKQVVAEANQKLRAKQTACEFTYHEDINRVSIKVLDKETEEVIIEIPSEDTLKRLEYALEMAGLVVDERR